MMYESKKNSSFTIAVLLTHTFEYINILFFDFMLSLDRNTKYPISILRSNKLPIDLNRTHLTSLALKNPRVTHLLYLDTDIIPFHQNFLDIMVSYDLPIVGLLCTKKCPPYEPILFKHSAPEEQKLNGFWVKHPKGLVEVDSTGTGCLLVKREVLEEMKEPYFKFISSYEEGIHQSEDIYFLNYAKSKGIKVYVDTENTCMHVGNYGYGIHSFESYMKAKEIEDAKRNG